MNNFHAVVLAVAIGVMGTFYSGRDGQNQWVRLETPAGPIFVSVQHITSVSRSPVPSQGGRTEVHTMVGKYYTDDSLDDVIRRIVE